MGIEISEELVELVEKWVNQYWGFWNTLQDTPPEVTVERIDVVGVHLWLHNLSMNAFLDIYTDEVVLTLEELGRDELEMAKELAVKYMYPYKVVQSKRGTGIYMKDENASLRSVEELVKIAIKVIQEPQKALLVQAIEDLMNGISVDASLDVIKTIKGSKRYQQIRQWVLEGLEEGVDVRERLEALRDAVLED